MIIYNCENIKLYQQYYISLEEKFSSFKYPFKHVASIAEFQILLNTVGISLANSSETLEELQVIQLPRLLLKVAISE